MSHSNVNNALAAGMKALPDGTESFSQTQALWRFLANESVTFEALSQPLLEMAHTSISSHCENYVLAIHDWSNLNYAKHSSKKDKVQMSHEKDLGYELQSTVLVSDRNGSPLVSPVQNLVTANEILSSRKEKLETISHLDELTHRIQWLERQGFSKKIIHIIDREADSVGHFRQWREDNAGWLVRVKEGSRIKYNDTDMYVVEVANQLTYREVGKVSYKGKPARQNVAKATVILSRKTSSTKGAKDVEDKPLEVKLIVSRIFNMQGERVAQWCLLADVDPSIDEAVLATWYYYRWRIESYFKLLKQAGHQLESWEQETGKAVFKRLLIVAQACALVWRIMRLEGEKAQEFKAFLVRLSGRQMKKKQPVTASAVLDGLFKLYLMLEVLEQYSVDKLKMFGQMAKSQGLV